MSVEELEILRRKARNTILIGIFFTIILAIATSIILNSPFYSIYLIPLGIIITFIISIKPKKNFLLAFKDTFVLKSLKTIFTDLTYEPEKGLDESIIRDTKMMYMGV